MRKRSLCMNSLHWPFLHLILWRRVFLPTVSLPPSMAEWTQQSHFLANHAPPGVLGAVTCLYFDPFAELLWTGSASGHIASHTNAPPICPRYTAYVAHDPGARRSGVHRIVSNEKHIISAGDSTVRAVNRSGLGHWTVSMKYVVTVHYH